MKEGKTRGFVSEFEMDESMASSGSCCSCGLRLAVDRRLRFVWGRLCCLVAAEVPQMPADGSPAVTRAFDTRARQNVCLLF